MVSTCCSHVFIRFRAYVSWRVHVNAGVRLILTPIPKAWSAYRQYAGVFRCSRVGLEMGVLHLGDRVSYLAPHYGVQSTILISNCCPYFSTVSNFVVVVLMKETFAPVIIERIERSKGLQLGFNTTSPVTQVSKTAAARAALNLALRRPPRLLANPVCLIFSVYYAYVYAVLYLSLIMVSSIIVCDICALLSQYRYPCCIEDLNKVSCQKFSHTDGPHSCLGLLIWVSVRNPSFVVYLLVLRMLNT